MWRVHAYLIDGTTEEIGVIQSDGVAVSAKLVYETIGKFQLANLPGAHLVRSEMELGRKRSLPGRDAIEIWGKQFKSKDDNGPNDNEEKISFDDGALMWMSRRNKKPKSLAWHDRTMVVVPVHENYKHLVFNYVPSDENASLMSNRENQFGRAVMYLEWRGYFGEHSFVVDGFKKIARKSRSVTIKLTGKGGLLVGMIVNHIGRPQASLKEDPSYQPRLKDICDRYPEIASKCKDLRTIGPECPEKCIVFVHGMVSSCLVSLKDLYPQFLPDDVPVFRYEHDTFKPIAESGRELYELIARKISTKELLLLCHSRGGLVGRFAAQLLRNERPEIALRVWTFGTPHDGTPIVDAGNQLLGLIYRLSGEIVNGIPLIDYVGAALSYLLLPASLPQGISAMRPGSDFLLTLNFNRASSRRLRLFAGDFDISGKRASYVLAAKGGFGSTAFGGKANDLVVPQESALFQSRRDRRLWLTTNKRTPLCCSHFDYFQQDEVRRNIRECFNSRDLTQVPAPSPNSWTCSDIPIDDEWM